MSNELVKYSRTALAKSDETLSREAGKSLMGVGAGGLAIGAVAWVVPFVTLPMLLVVAALLGLYLYAK
jgi:uncharacterized protein (DUF2062 family)